MGDIKLVLLMCFMIFATPLATMALDYADALTKSILFFEGQRSGKLPSSQRMSWRKDSGLRDGMQPWANNMPIDLVGGYYDAGDNVKYNFPMAFTTTMLAWSVIEFQDSMGPDLNHALDAIQWATDYLLKSTSVPGVVYVQVGEPVPDHNCWERPEDMDTPRTSFVVNTTSHGSEVSGEIAAALAAASIAFKPSNAAYASILLSRAITVFQFADTYQGSYDDGLRQWVCPFYCDFSGYQDELIWAATWLYKATNTPIYSDYVMNNYQKLSEGSFAEFGWDDKHAGINVLLSQMNLPHGDEYTKNADFFVCSVMPESPTKVADYSPGGLMFKKGGSNMQHPTSLAFLLIVYQRSQSPSRKTINCGNVAIDLSSLVQLSQRQVDYILGDNPIKMSYMVGYGEKFPQRIHHRGSSIPSIQDHPGKIGCKEGSPYCLTNDPNPNVLTGALVGGPSIDDQYADSRLDFKYSEPTTYINAPFVGLSAFFKGYNKQ